MTWYVKVKLKVIISVKGEREKYLWFPILLDKQNVRLRKIIKETAKKKKKVQKIAM